MKPYAIAMTLRKAAGSVMAVAVGITTGVITMLVFGWSDWKMSLFMIALFAVPAWVFILLPLYVLLPRSSSLWRTGVCTVLGALGGAIIVALYLIVGGGFVGLFVLWFFLPIGALVGAVTCFFGAITKNYFHATQLA